MNRAAVRHHRVRRQQRARRLIHERHEFVRKSGHGAADADPSDVRATADPAHPSALADIALHHRTPASQLHDAESATILLGKFRLFVVAAAVAAFVNRLAEQPGGPQRLIERNHRRASGRHIAAGTAASP